MMQVLESRFLLAGEPIISEFLASNQNSVMDEDRDSSDWIEVRNIGDQSLDLDGWYLTDDGDDLAKWTFPPTALPAGGHLLIFASGKDRIGTGPGGEHHTNFRLSVDGEFLALVQPDGQTIASGFSPAYPGQFEDISYGVSAGLNSTGYFRQLTPGSLNATTPLADPRRHIIFSEIMYHPPSHRVEDEYVEIFNAGLEPVDMASWQIQGGVDYVLPEVVIQPAQHLLIAADVERFTANYPDVDVVVGGWQGRLSNSGETIELIDEVGQLVNRVEYADEGDWSMRQRGPVDRGGRGWMWSDLHDGGGRSLELVTASLPNHVGQNWAASTQAGGTPGAPNSVAADDGAPLILDTGHSPIIPSSNDAVLVTARIVDQSAADLSAQVHWRVDGAPRFNPLPMQDDGQAGDSVAGDGVYAAQIPAQPDGTVVEFYVESVDGGGLQRYWPAPTLDAGQAANLLYQVDDAFDGDAQWEPGSPVEYRQIMTAAERAEFASLDRFSNAQMNATFISVSGTGVDLRYNAGVRYRGSGTRRGNPPNNRINIPHDRPWRGVTALNINWNVVPDQVAGSALFRLAGLPAAEAKAVRMLSNGRDLYNGNLYAHVEPLNSDFARNHFPTDSNGNLYKGQRPDESPPGGLGAGLAYHGPDPGPYVSYSKLTNTAEADYTDVIDLTARLNLTSDEDYVAAVSSVIDVDQWMRFFALNALLDNSEGGLVNGDPLGDDYAMYGGVGDPRFQLIPHDLDSLFGEVRRAFYRARGNAALNRFFAQPEFLSKYQAQLRDLLDNVLLTELAATTLREAMRNVAAPAAIDSIMSFLAARGDFIRSQLPDAQPRITLDTGLPTIGGFPRTTTPFITLAGTAPAGRTQSVLVNGIPAQHVLPDGTWSFSGDFPANTETLVRAGSDWSYLDDGSNQGTAWREVDFNDANWKSGPAPLGYGDNNEATVVGFIDTAPGGGVTKNATTYFRSHFAVDDPEQIARLSLRLRYDDAAAVYLNGVEVMRTDNLPPNAAFNTYATAGTPSEDGFVTVTLPASARESLVAGRNWLAAEVHQRSPTSSDIKFDLELLAEKIVVGEPDLALNPGINRILVQAFAGPEASGAELVRRTLDVWYDDATEQTVSGTLAGETVTWTAAEGPYHVTGDVTVPVGTTLVIEPGTSVYFDQGIALKVRGTLIAAGTQFQRIRFSSVPNAPLVPDRPNGISGLPAGPPRWGGIHFQNSNAAENIIAHADVEYAQSNSGSIGLERSSAVIDNVSFRGTHLRMIYANNSAYQIRNSVFPDMFAANEEPQALGLDNGSEHITSVGTPANGGQMVIQGNSFGTNKGHNDVIDAVSGRYPGPILEIRDNTFAGSQDELLDLGGDVYVAGNHFVNVFKAERTSDRGYANAISTGDAAHGSTVVVARNVFWDVDHAVNLKNNDAAIFENNTVVQVHDDFVDGLGLLNVASAINLFVDEAGAVSGAGAYAADNIFWNVPRVFGGIDVPAGILELHSNLLDPSLAQTGTWLDLGDANRYGRPGFQNEGDGRFSLRSDSPARAAGSLGQDLGALIRPGIWIMGEPLASTGSRNARLTVGGPGIFAYRFRVNAGPWSEEISIGDRFDPAQKTIRRAEIALEDLADGTYTVEVLGRDFAGRWQDEPTVSKTWTVGSSVQPIINEVLAKNFVAVNHFGSYPDLIELHNPAGNAIDLSGYSISDDLRDPRKYVFDDTSIPANGFLILYADNRSDLPGIHLGFSLRQGGEGVYLFDSQGEMLDVIEFGTQVRDLSIGRIGSDGQWKLTVPTFGDANMPQPLGDPSVLRINEWLASSRSLADADFVELFNPEPLPVALSGMFLSDEPAGNPRQHQIAPLSFVAASGFAELIADGNEAAGPNHLSFRLSADQEVLGLFGSDGTLLDQVVYYPQTTDVSQGRLSNGEPGYAFFAVPTPGRPNLTGELRDGEIFISELHYHAVSANELSSEDDLEFVEIRNGSTRAVDISGWRLHEAVDYEFPVGTVIGPGAAIAVVAFDPAAEPAKDLAFRGHHEIPAQAVLVGPFDGQLSNRGETVELSRPVTVFVPQGDRYESVDAVRYRDEFPWPEEADGGGLSLSRKDSQIIGSLPGNWEAASPTPGDGEFAGWGDVNADGDVDSRDIDALRQAIRDGAVDAIFDLDGNASVDSSDVTFLVESILRTDFGDTNLDQKVDFSDFLILAENFGAANADWDRGDFDGDGEVSFLDFLLLAGNFGRS